MGELVLLVVDVMEIVLVRVWLGVETALGVCVPVWTGVLEGVTEGVRGWLGVRGAEGVWLGV